MSTLGWSRINPWTVEKRDGSNSSRSKVDCHTIRRCGRFTGPRVGSDASAPHLVVLLSTAPSKPGTPFVGIGPDLAGLFQINGVEQVRMFIERRSPWQSQK
jgi:hypothetical protein